MAQWPISTSGAIKMKNVLFKAQFFPDLLEARKAATKVDGFFPTHKIRVLSLVDPTHWFCAVEKDIAGQNTPLDWKLVPTWKFICGEGPTFFYVESRITDDSNGRLCLLLTTTEPAIQ